jgi:hypothetical protein
MGTRPDSDEGPTALTVRVASSADADAVGQLLHDFNSEFGEPTPGPDRLAERIRRLLAVGDTTILLGGTGPDGVAVLASGRRSGATLLSAISPSSTSCRRAGVAGWAGP